MVEQTSDENRRDPATHKLAVGAVNIVYRETGASRGVPIVALTHLGANLDDWDPRIVDGLAEDRRVILLGYHGVGRSSGSARTSIEQMAEDAILVIRALGLTRIDLFGLSMGGMVAQEIAHRAPGLIDRLILASSGPAGGPGLSGMTRVMVAGTVRALTTLRDPRSSLFFTRTVAGRTSARAYRKRLGERTRDRDSAVSIGVIRAQLAAVKLWGSRPPAERSPFDGPVLLVHGDSDRMVPAANAAALEQIFRAPSLTVYADAGHGAVSQYHDQFVAAAVAFLRR